MDGRWMSECWGEGGWVQGECGCVYCKLSVDLFLYEASN